jgi:uncharacterized protein
MEHNWAAKRMEAVRAVGADGAPPFEWHRDCSRGLDVPSFWARYLCGGGCQVVHRGRPACDHIRGWLHDCPGAYGSLVKDRPPLLADILHAQRKAR